MQHRPARNANASAAVCTVQAIVALQRQIQCRLIDQGDRRDRIAAEIFPVNLQIPDRQVQRHAVDHNTFCAVIQIGRTHAAGQDFVVPVIQIFRIDHDLSVGTCRLNVRDIDHFVTQGPHLPTADQNSNLRQLCIIRHDKFVAVRVRFRQDRFVYITFAFVFLVAVEFVAVAFFRVDLPGDVRQGELLALLRLLGFCVCLRGGFLSGPCLRRFGFLRGSCRCRRFGLFVLRRLHFRRIDLHRQKCCKNLLRRGCDAVFRFLRGFRWRCAAGRFRLRLGRLRHGG